jgi:hypothetical protein
VNKYIVTIFFIAGSVASASFNVAEWNETTRGVVASFWIFSEVAVFIISINVDDILK